MRSDTPPLIDFGEDDLSALPPHSPLASSPPFSFSALPIVPDLMDDPLHTSIRDTAENAVAAIVDNGTALSGIIAKLEHIETIIHFHTLHQSEVPEGTYDGVLADLRTCVGMVSDASADLLRMLKRSHEVGGQTTIVTSAIANARDRDPSPFSSGPSRPSMASTSSAPVDQSTTGTLMVDLQDYVVETLPHPQVHTPDDDDISAVSAGIDASPTHDIPLPRILSPMRQKRSATGHFTRQLKTPKLSKEPSDEIAIPEAETLNGMRRSSRTQLRPQDYYNFARPGDPSYTSLKPTSKSSRKQKQKSVDEDQVTLGRSDGRTRVPGAEWPALSKRSTKGIAMRVVCGDCEARCHLICSGLIPEEASKQDWVCPDCWHLSDTSLERLKVPVVGQMKCIRPDCILSSNHKHKRPKTEIDELDYRLERIIGRRRAPDYTPKDRIFEYLLLWTSVDETAEQVWGVEDATWEPECNLLEISNDREIFHKACIEEGVEYKVDGVKPIMLAEALWKWDEEGELKGDGWSKRKLAEIDQKLKSPIKRSHKKGQSSVVR